MLGRGILRERMWAQTSCDLPDLTLVMWDCDDLDVATRPPAKTARSAHEDWLFYTVLGTYHGQSLPTFRFPQTEVVSGTTTQATAIADTQTMFALPVPPEKLSTVRQLLDRLDSGDLMRSHAEFLELADVREEWVWLQHARDDLPDMLLIHWTGDDLPGAMERMTGTESPLADMARAFSEGLGMRIERAAQRTSEPLFAMHVRRSDSFELGVKQTASRVLMAARRGRWDALESLLDAQVTVKDGRSGGGRAPVRTMTRGEAASLLASVVAGHGPELRSTDVLAGEDALVLSIGTDGAGTPGLAIVMGVADRTIHSVAVVPDWPGPITATEVDPSPEPAQG